MAAMTNKMARRIGAVVDKLVRIVVLVLLPIVLRWAHSVQPTDAVPFPAQPASALLALRIFVSIVPAILLVISIVVAYFYPITRARHAEIERQLAEQRASKAKRI
jgi:GPH family glycoside/pentoside/hexuronide:cation symporter